MKKAVVILLALAMIAGVFAGCAENAPPEEPAVGGTGIVNIGISLPTEDDDEWNRAGDLMKEGLSELGYASVLDYASNDVATQVAQIENMLNSGCNYLIIAPVEGDALGTVLDTAKEKNVPVISYDRMLMNSDAVSYYVAFDSYMTGQKQAEYIRDSLDLDATAGPYNIEFVAGDPSDGKARMMFSGAMDVLTPYIDEGKLNVRSGKVDFEDVATAAWAGEAAMSRMDAVIFANYSDGTTLHAVLCSSDSCASGVVKSLEYNYRGAWPIITGSGCEKENVKYILSGKQSMSLFCDTETLASRAVEMMKSLVNGGVVMINDSERYDNGVLTVPAFVCEPEVVDKDSHTEILIDSGFYTEDELK